MFRWFAGFGVALQCIACPFLHSFNHSDLISPTFLSSAACMNKETNLKAVLDTINPLHSGTGLPATGKDPHLSSKHICIRIINIMNIY